MAAKAEQWTCVSFRKGRMGKWVIYRVENKLSREDGDICASFRACERSFPKWYRLGQISAILQFADKTHLSSRFWTLWRRLLCVSDAVARTGASYVSIGLSRDLNISSLLEGLKDYLRETRK